MLSRLLRPNTPFTRNEKTILAKAPRSPAQNTFFQHNDHPLEQRIVSGGRVLCRRDTACAVYGHYSPIDRSPARHPLDSVKEKAS